jgi:hypothetical protein
VVARRFIVLGMLWLASQCVTDLIRHSEFADYARGWSNIGITLINFAVIYTLLFGRSRRIAFFGWGNALGTTLGYLLNPTEAAILEPWKFGYGTAVTLSVILIASRKECRGHWPIFLTAAIGLVNILMGFRNAGGICLVTAVYLLVSGTMQKRGIQRLKPKTIVIIAASMLIGTAGILWTYQHAAETGMLGEGARDEYKRQSSGKFGVLLGGRSELFASIPAIYDSPIIGHGSWAKDPLYILIQQRAMAEMGYTNAGDVDQETLEDGLIPTHSHIFGAWVFAGVLGAVFWGWVMVLSFRALINAATMKIILLPLVGYLGFSLLWDIMFSPFGYDRRVSANFSVVVLMSALAISSQRVARVVTEAKGMSLRKTRAVENGKARSSVRPGPALKPCKFEAH